jgi:hypothetical protein
MRASCSGLIWKTLPGHKAVCLGTRCTGPVSDGESAPKKEKRHAAKWKMTCFGLVLCSLPFDYLQASSYLLGITVNNNGLKHPSQKSKAFGFPQISNYAPMAGLRIPKSQRQRPVPCQAFADQGMELRVLTRLRPWRVSKLCRYSWITQRMFICPSGGQGSISSGDRGQNLLSGRSI